MSRKFRMGVFALIALSLILALSLSGCGKQTQPDPNPDPKPDEPQGGSFEFVGSDSEVNLVQSLIEAFAGVNKAAELSVTGGGSGVGIAALINGTTDVANSSRPMSQAEITKAKENKVDPVPIVFAFDGVSVIVREDNPVKELTMEQVGQIFKGTITNWKEVGGEDVPITLFGRQPTSGTFVFFRDLVVKGDYSPTMNQMGGNSAIVEGIVVDKGGIGYAAIGYVKGAKGIAAVSIAAKQGDPYISPLDDAKVFSGAYALTRPLFHYVNGKPTGALKQFFEFELSKAGQDIVVKGGFLPVTPEYVEQNKKYLN
jgi:phosphate transport system substrate-binding protein